MDVTTFTLWDYLLLAMSFIALVAVLWAIDARGWIGSKVAKLLPFATIQQGDKVHIYLNGEYNRTATLSKVAVDCVYIYDSAIRLPLSHRGRFYGIGVDAADGSHVVFITRHRHYRLIRVAELIRKVFGLQNEDGNLNPDYAEYEQLVSDVAEEGESDEC